MTTTAERPTSAPVLRRTAASVFLARRGDGTRRRSGTDALKLIAAVLLFALLWLGLSARVRLQADITTALHPAVLGLSWLATSVWLLTSAGTMVLVLLAAVLGRRLEIFRDLGIAGLVAWLTCEVSQHLLGEAARFPADAAGKVPGVALGFPVPLLATSVAVILASLPYLSRHLQRFLEAAIV